MHIKACDQDIDRSDLMWFFLFYFLCFFVVVVSECRRRGLFWRPEIKQACRCVKDLTELYSVRINLWRIGCRFGGPKGDFSMGTSAASVPPIGLLNGTGNALKLPTTARKPNCVSFLGKATGMKWNLKKTGAARKRIREMVTETEAGASGPDRCSAGQLTGPQCPDSGGESSTNDDSSRVISALYFYLVGFIRFSERSVAFCFRRMPIIRHNHKREIKIFLLIFYAQA